MIRTLCRLLLHLFFSEIRVHHSDRLPATGAVLIVANHHSGLVDPALLIRCLDRTPRFLAKSTLWNATYLPLRPFLSAARAIPVYRQKDGGGDNKAMFADSYDALEEGSVIALFAEGVSHDMPGLLDLKTGAARIALGVDGPVSVVPVGLIYDDRARYRSQVSVVVGEPFVVEGSPNGDADRDRVNELTELIDERLSEVAPSWESWHQHDEAQIAARLAVAADPILQYGEVLTSLNNAVDDGHAGALAMCAAVELLEEEADRIGIDLDIVVDEPVSRFDQINRRSILESFVWWPVVWVGRLANLLPFLGIRVASRSQGLSMRATFKILVGVFAYPLWWIALGILVGWLSHPLIGVAVAFAAPILGYLSARVHPRLRHLTNRLSVESFREIDPEAGSALVARRSAVVAVTKRILATTT